jgi:hypothetical protein
MHVLVILNSIWGLRANSECQLHQIMAIGQTRIHPAAHQPLPQLGSYQWTQLTQITSSYKWPVKEYICNFQASIHPPKKFKRTAFFSFCGKACKYVALEWILPLRSDEWKNHKKFCQVSSARHSILANSFFFSVIRLFEALFITICWNLSKLFS